MNLIIKDMLNEKYYDCRLDDYFTITEVIDENFVFIRYDKKKHRDRKESISFINYHIQAGQYLKKII